MLLNHQSTVYFVEEYSLFSRVEISQTACIVIDVSYYQYVLIKHFSCIWLSSMTFFEQSLPASSVNGSLKNLLDSHFVSCESQMRADPLDAASIPVPSSKRLRSISEGDDLSTSRPKGIPEPRIKPHTPARAKIPSKLQRSLAAVEARRWFEDCNTDATATAGFDCMNGKQS